MSDTLRPHELQHARPPCPSPTLVVYPNLCPLSRWCHPTISSSVVPFSSCPQSFPAPGSFQMSQLFTSGGQSIRVSASTSILPMNTQDWSPLRERKLTTGLLNRLLTNLSSYGCNSFKYFLYNTGQEATVRTRHGMVPNPDCVPWYTIKSLLWPQDLPACLYGQMILQNQVQTHLIERRAFWGLKFNWPRNTRQH